MGIHRKIQFLGGGGAVAKNQYIGEIAEKGEAWTYSDLKGDLAKKGGVFEGELIPQCTL